jgi:hypothetical protein
VCDEDHLKNQAAKDVPFIIRKSLSENHHQKYSLVAKSLIIKAEGVFRAAMPGKSADGAAYVMLARKSKC